MAVAHGARGHLYQMSGGLEAEGDRIADVQVAHPDAARLDCPGFGHDIANRIREAVDAGGHRDRRRGLGGRHSAHLSEFARMGHLSGSQAGNSTPYYVAPSYNV